MYEIKLDTKTITLLSITCTCFTTELLNCNMVFGFCFDCKLSKLTYTEIGCSMEHE